VCSDLERSIEWYESTLGLRIVDRESDVRAPGASFGAPGDAVRDAARLDLPARPGTYAIRLERWRSPAAAARPRAVANQLGPFRIAFLVADVHAWHAELVRLGVPCTGAPVWLDMGPEIPIDGLWAMFFFDPDGACLELIQV
jgi:catechol 2,3-dioxygenase-like lactoylglutathione lyase family enzyme